MHTVDKTSVEARGLCKVYWDGGRELPVLQNITMAITSGEAVAILGPSGCGKTTLINLLSGLDTPTSGAVMLGGEPLSGLTQTQKAGLRARLVGFVFQSYHLMAEFTALENVELAAMIGRQRLDPRRRRVLAETALERVGLSDRMHHFSTELSGGQQQRVAIARALVNDPEIIFFDEPTGNLDPQTGQKIIELVGDLHESGRKTMVLVTHDQRIAQNADRVFSLVTGRWTKG